MGRYFNYQLGLALLTGLVTGLVFFDRMLINILSPFLVAELKLTNAQLGTASSALSLTWAAAGYLVGRRSDRAGRRKPYYVAAIIAFSLFSMAAGLAGGFPGLVGARLLMGAAEGAVPVLGTALLLSASTPERRGLNMSISSLGGALLAGALSPFVVVGLATHLGWRAAFFLTGIPGLLVAAAVAWFIREAPATGSAGAPQSAGSKNRLAELLRVRNLWLCGLISSLLVAGNSVSVTFTPIFLVASRHLQPSDMGVVMTAHFLAIMVGGITLFALSDRLGRKPVLIGFAALAASSICSLYGAGTTALLAALMAVAGLCAVIPGFSIGMIPGESVADRDRGTVMGATMGVAEIFGGFAAPALAGLAADHFGRFILPAIAASCYLAGALLSFALKETAPGRTGGTAMVGMPALAPSE